MSERALVLGGGGASGNAWVIGVIAGLFEAGVDVTEADLVIGTSAVATAAAQVTASRPSELFARIVAEAPETRTGPATSEQRPRPAADQMEWTGKIIASAKDAADMRRRMGAAAIEMDAASSRFIQSRWRATVAARLPSQHWPEQRLLITAVDARSGEPVVFDRHSGVDVVDAVAASCASGFAYTIGERQYIDGGYRANENADLAAGCSRILVLSPFGGRSRHPAEWGTHLAAQVSELRAQGSRVETIFPDANARDVLATGMGVMELSTRLPAARAGYAQGAASAERLSEFWCSEPR